MAETPGMRREQLARLDTHLTQRYVEPRKIPGAVTLVARGGEIAHLSALGMRDLERSLPMQEDTIFRIYSMTKPITSIALMQLFERGIFQLDDPVARWIPEWSDLRVFRWGNHPNFLTEPPDRGMTIADLLTHRAGLTYGFMECTNVDAAYRELGVEGSSSGGTLQGMVETLAGLPLEFSPGAAWNYSVATDVCGHLVEVMSGQSLPDYFDQHIFSPLGMVDTGFHVPEDKASRFAANYDRGPDKSLRLIDDPTTSTYLSVPTFFSGGGGLVSTAHDYFRFCQMLARGGNLDGQHVIGRKTLELMTHNHLPDGAELASMARGSFSETTYDGVGFGLGFAVTLDPVRAQQVGSAGEFFWGGAASTIFWVDPTEDLVVVFLTQLMPSGTFNFRGQLKSIVYPALL